MSRKVSALSDFEHRVWTQYILSADDFGVMPASAFVLQADNAALATRPTRKVQAALETVISMGLVLVFTHQGTRYVWQKDWQDWQEIRWPRRTSRPLPPVQTEATEATQRLFREHAKKVAQNFGETSERLTSRARARNPNPHPNPNSDPDLLSKETEISTGDPPAWKPAGPLREVPGLYEGREARSHGMHAWCGRVCVPWGLHADLERRLGGDDAKPRLLAWYPAVLARYEGRELGDDLFDFWRHEFAAWVGTVTSKPVTGAKTADTMRAGATSLERRLKRIEAQEGLEHGEPPRALKG